MDKDELINFLKNLDIYNDFYGGNVIDIIIYKLEEYFNDTEERETEFFVSSENLKFISKICENKKMKGKLISETEHRQ